jgi:hypothetical protein
MEFWYVFFQASNMAARNFLAALLQNHHFAGSAYLLSPVELAETVEERVALWANLCLGTLRHVGS